jgi:purine-nucleoside phosphorylase
LQPPLRPSAPIAADVLLIGDPARAMQVAQELIEGPKMSNHAHGLWGYGGRTADGRDLTIQSVGIGGPSAALVLSQLAGLGVRRAVLLGTCRAISSRLSLGDVFAVGEAIGADGVSGELSDDAALLPDRKLGATLAGTAEAAGLRSASVASTDLIGELDGRPAEDWERRGAEALEMTAAALFAAGPKCGVAMAALMAVADVRDEAISDEALLEASVRMGKVALAAFSSSA